MKTRQLNKERKYSNIPYNTQLNYLVDYEETILKVDPLIGDIIFSIDTRFSFFGDSIKINFQSSNLENRNIQFKDGILSSDANICSSCWIEFQFDGNNFIPISGSSELRIGSHINKSNSPGLLYTKDQKISQDPDHFYYNDSNKRLGIGMNTPGTHLSICGRSNKGQVHILNNSEDNESSIGMGMIGKDIQFVFGMFNDKFGVKDIGTGKFYNLLIEEIKEIDKSIKKKTK